MGNIISFSINLTVSVDWLTTWLFSQAKSKKIRESANPRQTQQWLTHAAFRGAEPLASVIASTTVTYGSVSRCNAVAPDACLQRDIANNFSTPLWEYVLMLRPGLFPKAAMVGFAEPRCDEATCPVFWNRFPSHRDRRLGNPVYRCAAGYQFLADTAAVV